MPAWANESYRLRCVDLLTAEASVSRSPIAWIVYGLVTAVTPTRMFDPALRTDVCTPSRLPLMAMPSAPACHSSRTSSRRSASVTTRICMPLDSRGVDAPSEPAAMGSARSG